MEETNPIKYTKEDIRATPVVMEAVVFEIKDMLGKQIFVDKHGTIKTDKPDKEFLVLEIVNDNEHFETSVNIPKYAPKNVPDGSKLAKFLKKYGELSVGTKVILSKNSEGFYDLVL